MIGVSQHLGKLRMALYTSNKSTNQPASGSYVTPTAIPLLVTCDFLGAGGIGENLLGSVDRARVQKACELANTGFTCVVAEWWFIK